MTCTSIIAGTQAFEYKRRAAPACVDTVRRHARLRRMVEPLAYCHSWAFAGAESGARTSRGPRDAGARAAVDARPWDVDGGAMTRTGITAPARRARGAQGSHCRRHSCGGASAPAAHQRDYPMELLPRRICKSPNHIDTGGQPAFMYTW